MNVRWTLKQRFVPAGPAYSTQFPCSKQRYYEVYLFEKSLPLIIINYSQFCQQEEVVVMTAVGAETIMIIKVVAVEEVVGVVDTTGVEVSVVFFSIWLQV